MGYDIVVKFKKVFVKCSVPKCSRKHYARNYCEIHYHRFYRSKYCHTWNEYLNYRIAQRLKETTKNEIIKPEISIKYKRTREFYQKLKEANITVFQYKDIINLVNWKYQRIKKHVLRLVKMNKIISTGGHSGGKHAAFKIIA